MFTMIESFEAFCHDLFNNEIILIKKKRQQKKINEIREEGLFVLRPVADLDFVSVFNL
jgi:hypothetical protein